MRGDGGARRKPPGALVTAKHRLEVLPHPTTVVVFDRQQHVPTASLPVPSTVPYVFVSAHVVPFEKLPTSDLHLDAVYLGGDQKNVKDDPLDPLVPGVGNQGGFRYVGSPWKKTVRLSVLYTSGVEVDWPDSLDPLSADMKNCPRADMKVPINGQ